MANRRLLWANIKPAYVPDGEGGELGDAATRPQLTQGILPRNENLAVHGQLLGLENPVVYPAILEV